MPFYFKLSAATQKMGLEFDRTEFAPLPNGKKIGYSVSDTGYSLYYGAAFDSLATFGPVDISTGLSWLTRGSNSIINKRVFVGSSFWVNDVFEVRALAGVHSLDSVGDSHVSRITLGLSLEVLCPVNDSVAMTMTYSPSMSGDQMLSIGVGWILQGYRVKDRIRRDGFDTALEQATQTLKEIKNLLSADNINAVATQYKEPAQVTFRKISVLRNAINYMLYPKYPWSSQHTMGFSDMVVKAKGEIVFAKSMNPYDHDYTSKIEQEIDNLPNQLADNLASDVASDKYGILMSLREMTNQSPGQLKQGAAVLGEYIDNYKYAVQSLESIAIDPVLKKKIKRKTAVVVGMLDDLNRTIKPFIQNVEQEVPAL